MSLTVGLAVFLIMLVSKERLLTASTNKMLNMPVFAEGSHDSLLYGPMAGLADRYTHLVVAWKAVELSTQLACSAVQFLTAMSAVEVVGMVRLLFVLDQHVFFYDAMATVADVLAAAGCFLLQVAGVAQSSAAILHKSSVGQFAVA